MNPAEAVIEKFGSQSALARELGLRPGTVQHWAKTGRIPAKRQAEILATARKQQIKLAASDFFDSRPEQSPPKPPEPHCWGDLRLGDLDLPVYVLRDGRRVLSRTGATSVLTANKGGGNLESYIKVKSLAPYLPSDLADQLIEFRMPGVVNKQVLGMTAETFLDICRAYVRARDDGQLDTERQQGIAIQANMVLSACAKVGLIALIDEATGYQYERADDALRFKLKLYLEEEMRQWEKTFPDELWREFGRLTNWKGALHQRPKYWGKLVMELVYEYLDPDVAEWLKKNAPQPRRGQNYHQWLTSQYGLRKLIEHVWMLIGMASSCATISELRDRMAQKFGREGVQLRLFLPPPDHS